MLDHFDFFLGLEIFFLSLFGFLFLSCQLSAKSLFFVSCFITLLTLTTLLTLVSEHIDCMSTVWRLYGDCMVTVCLLYAYCNIVLRRYHLPSASAGSALCILCIESQPVAGQGNTASYYVVRIILLNQAPRPRSGRRVVLSLWF